MAASVSGRELILEILLQITRDGEYSHIALKNVLDQYQYLDKKERAFITRVVDGTLERMIELDYIIDQFSKVKVGKMKPVIRTILRSGVYQLKYMDSVPDSAVCNEAVKLAVMKGFQNLKGFVNGVLRNISRNLSEVSFPSGEDGVYNLSVRYSLPEWMLRQWLGEYDEETVCRMAEEFLKVRPVTIRCSTDRMSRDELIRVLKAEGVSVREDADLPYALHISGFDHLTGLKSFCDGLYQVQDISSMQAGEWAEAREGDYVIDVCAAPGGKSILACEMAGKGRVLARDLSEEKIARIRENGARMKAGNIEIQAFDGTRTDESLLGKADVVLLDVPCSGLGVMGKKRDIKYRIKPENLESLQALQRQIARASAGYVKPGGTLLYSTCTIHSKENQAMVRFLTEELDFEPVSLKEVLPESILEGKRRTALRMRESGTMPAVPLTEAQEAACIQLLPGILEADGFFMARFRRKS